MRPNFLIVVSLIVFAFATEPRANAAAQVAVGQSSGSSVIASFESLDASGCVITDTFVFADSGIFNNPPPGGPTPSIVAGIGISQFDQCSGLLTIAAAGSTDQVSLNIATDLSTATLTGTIPVDEVVSGTTLYLTVNMKWTATADIVHQVSNSHVRVPGFVAAAHFNGDLRDGLASGSVSGSGQEFTPGVSISAQFEQLVEGQVSVQVTKK
jgi:hypothetical protein